jgi:hypothetical protein
MHRLGRHPAQTVGESSWRARRLAEFAKAPRSTIVGVSLTTVMPTGPYHSDRLVNIGTHRWTFKPEVGATTGSAETSTRCRWCGR